MAKKNQFRFTTDSLKKSKVAHLNQHIFNQPKKKHPQPENGRLVAKHFEKRKSAEKNWLAENLLYWCNDKALSLVEEHKFCEHRHWKSDWFIPGLLVLIEFEGLFSEKSRHTTAKGYSNDTEKYNQASKQGLTLLRYTAITYKNVLQDLDNVYKKVKGLPG
jgi:hypothetical protein